MGEEEISLADVDQAEAALADAKAAFYASDKGPEASVPFKAAKLECNQVRQAYRTQEVAAGRRGPVGGDAVKEN
jgi:hypothetical protein